MSQTSFPWEDIDTSETQFSQMFRHVNNGVNGVPTGDELQVVPGFSGLTVDVLPGEAMVRGHYYISTLPVELTLATADATNDRIDTVVLRMDPVANEIVAVVLTGTPAAVPVAPSLTQVDPYGVFEFPLADVLVEATAGVPGVITERRSFMGERVGSWGTAGRPDTAGRPIFGYNTDLGVIEFFDGTGWRIAFPVYFEETSIKTADYTLAYEDINKVVAMNVSGFLVTGVVTVPDDSSVPFPIGTIINVYNLSSNNLSIVGAAGVTVRNAGSLLTFGEASLRKRATNEWVLAGGVV
jgi:hypothetical protein